ncbi:hypothetical protein TcWFU_003236 [Taenia crassiceps]|uniref:WH2 domain-containing protein n=1 Tax=Taenia crassiceps TaxID=6207 RepID=A0ABR4QQ27_9CEST
MFHRSQTKQKRTEISSPFGFQHVQRLGFDKESQQLEVVGIDHDLLRAFLDLSDLKEKVKTDSDREFALNYIEENVGAEKFKEVMQKQKPTRPTSPLPTTHFDQHATPATRPVPMPRSFPPKPKFAPPPLPTEMPSYPKIAPPLPPSSIPKREFEVENSAIPPAPPPPSLATMPVSSGDDGSKSELAAPTSVSFLDEIRSFNKAKLKNIEMETTPMPSPPEDSSRESLEASLSNALSKLLSQRRQYLAADENEGLDST